jgi:hypothetical protein
MPKLKTNRGRQSVSQDRRRLQARASRTSTTSSPRRAASASVSSAPLRKMVHETDVGRLARCCPISDALKRGIEMARVKRGVTAGRRHKKVLKKAKGYYNARARSPGREAGGHQGRPVRLPRSAGASSKRDFRALWIVRGSTRRARPGPVLQPHDRRPEEGRHRDRSQGAG